MNEGKLGQNNGNNKAEKVVICYELCFNTEEIQSENNRNKSHRK